ncbi:serine/threonine-protein kinase [Streptomyces sp. NPDC002004]
MQPSTVRPLESGEPTAIGPYRLLGRLGSGGMGRVYLGRSAGGRTVAVKVVHPHFALDEEFRARFRREVEAARRVGGAFTAPVLDADPDAPVPWVATGYVAGPSLAHAVGSPDGGTPLPEHSVRVLAAGLAESLAHVHGLGLVHRDVKPSNVLLALDGPRLIDFGIARATEGTASLTSTGVSVGSPGYMAPEQILGKGVTGAADVFSLGAVMVYAATGVPPFSGDSSATLLYKVVHEEPEIGPMGEELRELATACLAKGPASRPSPAELARRLAPQGTARLASAGWLPGPLVEEVSRSAVSLLDLDAAPGPEAPSGPVEFTTPAVGAFGPPDPSYDGGPRDAAAVAPYGNGEPGKEAGAASHGRGGPERGPGAPAHGDSGAEPGPAAGSHGAPSAPVPPTVPPAPAEVPHPRTEVSDGGPGKLSVSLTAASAQGPDGRGRRLSCTVALAVAGALAAVTVGSAFLFDLLPGGTGGSHDTASGGHSPVATTPGAGDPGRGTTPSASRTPSPTPTRTPTATAAPAGGVPTAFLGTWKGPATGLGGSLPMGTFELAVHRASTGQEFATLTQTDALGGVCEDVLTLEKAAGDRLDATGRGKGTNPDHCSQTPHAIRLALRGDALTYASDDPKAGNPQATMARVTKP